MAFTVQPITPYNNSLPPITKAYGTSCVLATTLSQLGLASPIHITLIPELVFKHFRKCKLIVLHANISLYGLVNLKAFYLPWAILALDLLGIIAGHLYYFLTVLHSLATGKNYLKTPKWVNKLVARWRTGALVAAREASGVGAAVGGGGGGGGGGGDRAYSSARAPPESLNIAFRGRSYRLTD
ncbi:hypothetical protein BRARA_K00895 [Brassica rapa]|uniref:Derlin n=1 Tax=Brassica campestris TaxID=3711 RepID=A0A397L2G3_BRACM|nr:hypothetical protein BRARA_K00895 [Brassica rapa]